MKQKPQQDNNYIVLKTIVIILGIILVIGFAIVVTTIIYRSVQLLTL